MQEFLVRCGRLGRSEVSYTKIVKMLIKSYNDMTTSIHIKLNHINKCLIHRP